MNANSEKGFKKKLRKEEGSSLKLFTSEIEEIPPNEPQSRTLLDPSAARPWLERHRQKDHDVMQCILCVSVRRKKGRQTLHAAVELNPQIFSDMPSKSLHQVCALYSVLLQKRIAIYTSLKQLHPELPSVLDITTIKLVTVCYCMFLYFLFTFNGLSAGTPESNLHGSLVAIWAGNEEGVSPPHAADLLPSLKKAF